MHVTQTAQRRPGRHCMSQREGLWAAIPVSKRSNAQPGLTKWKRILSCKLVKIVCSHTCWDSCGDRLGTARLPSPRVHQHLQPCGSCVLGCFQHQELVRRTHMRRKISFFPPPLNIWSLFWEPSSEKQRMCRNETELHFVLLGRLLTLGPQLHTQWMSSILRGLRSQGPF